MSRLNFMEEQELAIQAIAEELAQLERLVLEGERIAPENAVLFGDCIKRADRIQSAIHGCDSNLPLREWMQKTGSQTTALDKWRRPELVKRT